MKFGVILPNYGAQTGRLAILDTALAAESQGYDSVWLTDHIAPHEEDAGRFGTIFEAVTTLAYLAGTTQRVKLGISSLVLPQRNPLEVAKQLATVDVLSGGRVMLAAGVGWMEREFTILGHDFHNRGKRMDEAVKVLRTIWRGGSVFSFQGKYYSFDKAVVLPGPVQAGGPELWIAGDSEKALRRAVLLADGWHPDGMEPEELSAMLAPARPLLLKRPFTVSMRIGVDFDAKDTPASLAGSSEQIVQKLQNFRAAGLGYAVLSFRADSQAARERAVQRFARDVAPALR